MNKISFVGFEYLDDWIHREVSVNVTLTITLFHHSVISSFPEPSLLKPLFFSANVKGVLSSINAVV